MIKLYALVLITLLLSVISGTLEGLFAIKLAKIFEDQTRNVIEFYGVIKIGGLLILSSVSAAYLNSYTSWKIWKKLSDYLFKTVRRFKLNPRNDISILTNTIYRDSNVVAAQVVLPLINAITKLLTIIVIAFMVYPVLSIGIERVNIDYTLIFGFAVVASYFLINRLAWFLVKRNNIKKHKITDMLGDYIKNRRSMGVIDDKLVDNKINNEFNGLAEGEGIIVVTSVFPKAVIEPLLIIGLIYFAYIDGLNIGAAIAGIFLFMRAVPHVNQIANGFMTSISRAGPLYTLWNEFKIMRKAAEKRNHRISAENNEIIKVSVEKTNYYVVSDINFDEKWAFIKIVGQSGSGKSTIVEGLLGYHNSSGTLANMMEDFDISLLDSNPIFLSKDINEFLIDNSLQNEALKTNDVESFLDKLEIHYLINVNRDICYISLGERQRLKLFEIFVRCSQAKFKKQIIIIDEGLSGVSPKMESAIIKFLIEFGIKIILVTHRNNIYKEDIRLEVRKIEVD